MAQSMSEEVPTLLAVKEEPTDSQVDTEGVEESSSSPLSSPPRMTLPNVASASDTDQKSTSRKRSYEDMKAELENTKDSSMTIVDEIDPAASQGNQIKKDIDPSDIKMSNTQAHSMPPPHIPASSMFPPSQKPPQSGQGSPNPPADVFTKMSTNASSADGIDEEMSNDVDSSEPFDIGETSDSIEPFDWDDLQQRYHEKIGQLNDFERDILAEFERLCNYFSIWAHAGSSREVDRSFKRMKTQMTLVQHHEDELEKKRQHYIKVVDAFKSALDLLAN